MHAVIYYLKYISSLPYITTNREVIVNENHFFLKKKVSKEFGGNDARLKR